MRTNKWIAIDGDIDFTQELRVFKYPVNNRNTNRLKKFCESHSNRIHTGSPYDCSGLVCGIYHSFSIMNNRYYIIERVTHFDY